MTVESTLKGGVASWAMRHPIGVTMLAFAVVILGLFAMERLAVDLLPHIIYPEVRVRVIDPGVPATIMEDRVTRQLEEQLAITEDAISVQSRSSEGSASVDLSFAYGKDIDLALRDASTRLDRAKRFLPDSIDAPIIYKRDPSQIPVLEFVLASNRMDSRELREWADYQLGVELLNLPGVAAVEIGGGRIREVQILPRIERMLAHGLSMDDLIKVIQRQNTAVATGRLVTPGREIGGRVEARIHSPQELAALPVPLGDGSTLPLSELVDILDSHEDERIKVRLNGTPGVKVSIQKQPNANTVTTVEAVQQRLQRMQEHGQFPPEIEVMGVSDQAIFIRNAINNASMAALSGAVLAMLVVYVFLGNWRRTLIIGSAIPLAIFCTLIIMSLTGLTLNIMTLGGLALGVGLLVDSTIVMLENIQRHQARGEPMLEAGDRASSEIFSAIVAATSTNLVAILPFLFVGGLVGLLFKELIITISAAMLASLVVAVSLVPALGVRVQSRSSSRLRRWVDAIMLALQTGYAGLLDALLRRRWPQALVLLMLLGGMGWAVSSFDVSRQEFLPPLDNGDIRVSISTAPGTPLEQMDAMIYELEAVLMEQPEVESVFSIVGGFIFGRTEREVSNRTFMQLQLVPRSQRALSSEQWIAAMRPRLKRFTEAGVRVFMRSSGIRGIRLGRGDDDFSLRLQGGDLQQLRSSADEILQALKGVEGLRNLQHSAEELLQELLIKVDREKAAALGFDPDELGAQIYRALQGTVVSDFLSGDRAVDIRMRLPREKVDSVADLGRLYLRSPNGQHYQVSDVASIGLSASQAEITRDNQRRIVEISASLTGERSLPQIYEDVQVIMDDVKLPEGYYVYDGGSLQTLQEGRAMGGLMLLIALLLVLVVMSLQYESLLNPLLIMSAVPFTLIGVAVGLWVSELSLSMPVWLGLIMLAGIVVNNAIVMVEYIEQQRKAGLETLEAVLLAARLRLRPILMTTLTTVAGMVPLALGLGEGAEMLQPLAVSIVFGLSFSLLVTLLLIPMGYHWLGQWQQKGNPTHG